MFRFGRPIEGERLAYWGARAIYKNMKIDLLPDRQTWEADEKKLKAESEAFGDWLNAIAIPALERLLKEEMIWNDSDKVVKFTDGQYYIEASPNASHGYLYIGAVIRPAPIPATGQAGL